MRVIRRDSFNSHIADVFGVKEAIVLETLIEYPRLRNSKSDLEKICYYFSSRQIAEALRRLEKYELIKSFQDLGMNRTKFYKATEKALSYYPKRALFCKE